MKPKFIEGDRVHVTGGLSNGMTGRIVGPSRLAETGVRMWIVDVEGHRHREIGEDWLKTVGSS